MEYAPDPDDARHAIPVAPNDSCRPPEGIAVVGIGLRMPGAVHTLDQMWDVLIEGRDILGHVPPDRFDKAWFTDPEPGRIGKSYTDAGGFLTQDVDKFDAGFFGIAPKEASRIDPQQRLLLECAVEAFEDAGINPSELVGSDTAVVMGVSSSDYHGLQGRRPETVSAYTNSGGAVCNTANRLSYFFDLQGPSYAVDTACSSALTAVHQACEALRAGDSDLALAGGVNILLSPFPYLGFSAASMLSPTGRCRPFSAAADGFVRSEGAGVVVLKRLERALADGDRLHAIILTSGVNNDGRSQGLALPRPATQAALLEGMYERARIEPDEVAYVEAHGTGTQAGDPVECQALGRALGQYRLHKPLPIGSVKANLGHLEAASAIAGLAKALLVLREGVIPATPHVGSLNGDINFTRLGLDPVTGSRPLPSAGRGLIGINSFGFGGANAHVVLAPPPAMVDEENALSLARTSSTPARKVAAPADGATTPLPFIISARTEQALTAAQGHWATFLKRADPGTWYDLAYTACRRRARYEHRTALMAASPREAAAALRALAAGEQRPGVGSAVGVERGRVAFVFNGNGAQWAGMGAEMLAADEAFAAEAAALDSELAPALGWSVAEQLRQPEAPGWVRTEVAQPLLFVVQAGLVAALEARGITPAAVCGHSVGEVAAAYTCGALDRAAACRVITERSRAQAATAGSGRMAAVGLEANEARQLLNRHPYAGHVVLAAVNSDQDVTVAGDTRALAALGKDLAARGVFFRDLELDYAFHSPAMDPMQPQLSRALADLAAGPGRIPMVSTVTSGLIDGHMLNGEYWCANVRQPVLFAEALRAVTGHVAACDVLVEIGPHPVLGPYLRRAAASSSRPIATVSTLTRATAGPAALHTAQAQLMAAGVLDDSAHFPRRGRVISAPFYPWQREKHFNGSPDWWLPPTAGGTHPLLGARQDTAQPTWQCRVDRSRHAWLADHKVHSAVVVPAASYVDMALAAGRELFDAPAELTGLRISSPLAIPWDDANLQLTLQTDISADGRVTVSSRTEHLTWTEHARGRLQRLAHDVAPALPLVPLRGRLLDNVTAEDHYTTCAKAGLPYGPAFRVLTSLLTSHDEVLASYATPAGVGEEYVAHPGVLDGALQAAASLLATSASNATLYLPTAIDTARCWKPLPPSGLIHLQVQHITDDDAVVDVMLTDDDGEAVGELTGCRLRRYPRPSSPHTTLVETVRAVPLHVPTATSSAPLPCPANVLAECPPPPRADDLRRRYGVTRQGLSCLSAHFTAVAVRRFLPRDQLNFRLEDLITAGVRTRHERLLHALIDTMLENGLCQEVSSGQWRLTGDPAPEPTFVRLLRQAPEEVSAVLALAACGRHLPDVLEGTVDPVELLLGDNDALASRVYDDFTVLRHLNDQACRLLRTAIAQWPEHRPLRILEVGAGTGSTTAELLAHLPAERTRYTFTDCSTAFFPKAKQRFAAFDFLDYQCLDLNADPSRQGFAPASYDVIIASNVLHATHDLTTTLRRTAELLADDGHLLAVESHSLQISAPVFGLLDSFWAATDSHTRPESPLLSVDAWTELLRSCGFSRTGYTGTDCSHGDFSVLLGARDPRTTTSTGAPPSNLACNKRSWVVVSEDGTDCPGSVWIELMRRLRAEAGEEQVRSVLLDTNLESWGASLRAEPDTTFLLYLPPSGATAPEDITVKAVAWIALLRRLAMLTSQQERQRIPADVWVVTEGAGSIQVPLPAPGVAAAVWGAARTLSNEQPQLTVRRVALAPTQRTGGSSAGLAGVLVSELMAATEEDEVLLSSHGRFIPRVRALPPAHLPSKNAPFTLAIDQPGPHYQLRWKRVTQPSPGPGEVVVRVAAAALNYRDIMTALGLVPGPQAGSRTQVANVGLECAGVVVAVGAHVASVTVGQRVAGAGVGCYGSHALLQADRLLPVPPQMTLAEAATLPVALLTVHHGLHHLARLARGDKLLIHGAAGGVGLAAVQYAQHIGADVFATAGTPAKRDLLRLLGVEYVFDSRSLQFSDEIMRMTQGEGIDVVLNSLTGEAMTRSLHLLKPGGRFVELGKREALADNSLPLAPFLHDLTYCSMDVSTLLRGASEVADGHLHAVHNGVHDGIYRPLPHRTYPATRIAEAFACLQHSRHIGKLVITFDGAPVPLQLPQRRSLEPGPSDTFLITGGFSGLGAATARHLATQGVRHLALVGRRAASTPGAPALLQALGEHGVQVSAYGVDVCDRQALQAVLDDIDDAGLRLAGVIHAAMVLDDAPLTDLTDERLRAVLAPKVVAGHLLDELTHGRDVDFFVVYSSGSVLVGNRLQAPYVAANLALDAMIQRRRQQGLPGLSVQWGAVTDTGYVHRTGRADEMSRFGMGGITSDEALAVLDALLTRHDVGVVAAGDFAWDRLSVMLPALAAPRTDSLIPRDRADRGAEQLRQALVHSTPEQAAAMVEDLLVELFAVVLQTSPDRIDRHRRLNLLGVDSLMATELSTRMHQQLGCELSTVELMAAHGLSALASQITARLRTTTTP